MHKILSAALVFMVLGCGLAYADATSSANSYIDWANMTIENGTSAGFAWGSEFWQKYDASWTNGTNNLDPSNPQKGYSAYNWNGVSSTNTVTNVIGYGYTTSGGMLAAEPYAFTDGIATTEGYGTASIHRNGWFSVSNGDPGTNLADLTFTINYDFNHILSTTSPDDWSSAYSLAELTLSTQGATGHEQYDFSGPCLDNSGTISVSGSFLVGDMYSIEAHLYSAASAYSPQVNAVPEPVSTTLFLLGGATLAVRRLRSWCHPQRGHPII